MDVEDGRGRWTRDVDEKMHLYMQQLTQRMRTSPGSSIRSGDSSSSSSRRSSSRGSSSSSNDCCETCSPPLGPSSGVLATARAFGPEGAAASPATSRRPHSAVSMLSTPHPVVHIASPTSTAHIPSCGPHPVRRPLPAWLSAWKRNDFLRETHNSTVPAMFSCGDVCEGRVDEDDETRTTRCGRRDADDEVWTTRRGRRDVDVKDCCTVASPPVGVATGGGCSCLVAEASRRPSTSSRDDETPPHPATTSTPTTATTSATATLDRHYHEYYRHNDVCHLLHHAV